MAKIIDGKMISTQIKEEVKEATAKLKAEGKEVTLAVIQVGNDPASSVYVGNKKKACEYVGFRSLSYELAEETTEKELLDLIEELNGRADVDGILVQLPIPKHMDEDKVIAAISPDKDVDGFHAVSVGHLWIGKEGFVSCTPAGIIELLKRSDIDIAGKECVVVGRSNIVGKPMAALMLRENATVTVCHSRTADLKEVTKRADILIVAIGKPQFITADYVKPGATANLSSEFGDAGINQTNHRISLDMTVMMTAALPMERVSIELKTAFLVCETVLVGEVPQTVLQLELGDAMRNIFGSND